jgi:MFS family permease
MTAFNTQSYSLSRYGEYSLLVSAMLTIMVGAAIAPGLTTISTQLGVQEYAPLLITTPALGAILFAPLFGRLIDKIGARRTLLISLWGYFIFGCAGAFLHGPLALGVDRILLGGFTAGQMAAGTAVISQWFHGPKRLSMIAKQGMAIELGGVIFLFFGGLLTELHWQAPFLIYALALVCALFVSACVPKAEPLSTPQASVTKPQRLPSQAVPHSPSVVPIMAFTVMAMSLFFSMFIMLPEHLAGLGFGEAETGYLLSFISFIAVLSAMLMPKIVARVGNKMTLVIAFVAYGLAHGLFASTNVLVLIIAGAIAAGVGFGFSIPVLNHRTVEVSSEENRGKYLSYFAMAVFSGQFLTSALDFIPLTLTQLFLVCGLLAFIFAVGTKLSRFDAKD